MLRRIAPKNRMKCPSVLLALTLPLAACSAVKLRVVTQGEYFQRAVAEDPGIPFAVENRGSATVYLQQCGDLVMAAVDRWTQGRWGEYSGTGCLAIYAGVSLALASGERFEGTQVVREAGVYRLRLGRAGSQRDQPVWDAVSNTFEVQ